MLSDTNSEIHRATHTHTHTQRVWESGKISQIFIWTRSFSMKIYAFHSSRALLSSSTMFNKSWQIVFLVLDDWKILGGKICHQIVEEESFLSADFCSTFFHLICSLFFVFCLKFRWLCRYLICPVFFFLQIVWVCFALPPQII